MISEALNDDFGLMSWRTFGFIESFNKFSTSHTFIFLLDWPDCTLTTDSPMPTFCQNRIWYITLTYITEVLILSFFKISLSRSCFNRIFFLHHHLFRSQAKIRMRNHQEKCWFLLIFLFCFYEGVFLLRKERGFAWLSSGLQMT